MDQRKFRIFQDVLFTANKTANDVMLQKTAVNLGLDMHEFNAYRQSNLAKAQLISDISVAGQLGINATPPFF